MMNYLKIIKYLYSEADADPVSGNFAVTTRPKIGQRTIARPKIENNRAVVDEEGNPIMETVEITGPTDEIETVITKWDLPNPQPTITELEAYSQTQEYQDHLATEEREEQETSTAHERAKNLLKKIQQERQWLRNNWDDLDTAAKLRNAVSRVMKENDEILEALVFLIRRSH